MLEISGLAVNYGNIRAIHDVSLSVQKGEIVTVIGANGAGKTTTMKTIAGLLKPAAGSVTFMGERIDSLSAAQIVKKGIALVPEGRRVFPRLSVEDNLVLGGFTRSAAEVKAGIEYAFHLFPRLLERRRQPAGTLSGGEQQMLAMCRALMSKPSLLLLDEPSMGLAPILVKQIFETIRAVNETAGTTIVVVEQNAKMALKLATRGYVFETGTTLLSGSSGALLDDPRVRAAYLGEQSA